MQGLLADKERAELRQSLWEEQESSYQFLDRLDRQSLTELYRTEGLTPAFQTRPAVIGCIDDRLSRIIQLRDSAQTLNLLPLAGTGIFLRAEQQQAVAQKYKADGLVVVATSKHFGCGACQMVQSDYPALTLDQISDQAARGFAEVLGIAHSKPISFGYDSSADVTMKGSPDLHHARVIYIIGTRFFDPSPLGWPDGFYISARYAPDDKYLAEDLGVAFTIARGPGGMGFDEYFSVKEDRLVNEPLLVVLVGDETDPANSCQGLAGRLGRSLDIRRDFIKVLNASVPAAVVHAAAEAIN